MPSLDTTLSAGVTMTPAGSGATSRHTNTYFGFILVNAKYPSKKRKSNLVSLPYMNGAYDFSRINNNTQYYERVEVEYTFAQQYETANAMHTSHFNFETYCWGFTGTLVDDYGKYFDEAVCESFEVEVLPQANVLQVTVRFSANGVS